MMKDVQTMTEQTVKARPAAPRRGTRRGKIVIAPRLTRWLHHLVILVPLFLTFFPFIMALQISFKSYSQILHQFWFPVLPLYPENYVLAWNQIKQSMLNSAFVSGMSVLGILLCASLAAYAFARMRFLLRGFFYYVVIALLMIPGVLTLIGRFLLIARFNLLDSFWGLILPYVSGGLAFAIFLLTGFFRDLPEDLFESARMDGATEFIMYWYIALPLSRPVMSTVGLLSFLSIWGDYIWPLVVLQDSTKFTLIVRLARFSGSQSVMYGPLMAGYVLASIPTAIMILLMMKTFAGSALAGAIK